ncbi:probable chitinase 2 [Maniola hyperantus]|uniref:probable chitinase 2 n=1 Tax=Aphantopus hyperantus TaxID=2795564 RepID=UPI001568E998|nr:probable chitinase 2 [Maniola hyperantus]
MVGKCVFFLIFSVMASVMDGQTLGGPMHDKVVVCYVATWAVYRPGAGKYDLADIEPSLCTHLVYSFAGLDESTSSIKSLDPWQDLEKDYGKAGYKRLVSLKERYPHLKVTIAIGGWNEGSDKYSRMASKPETRAKFVESVMLFLNTYKFDGLDLDWEYPTKRGGTPEDRNNYVAMVKELKDAFEPYGYILTAALGAGKETMDTAYDLARLSRYLDFIHMMCYDYHGTWDNMVGANAPLRGTSEDDFLSIEYTIKYLLSHGVSPYKMILGLPMYGRNFLLANPSVKSIKLGHTPAKNIGFAGPYTRESGFIGYNEICEEMTNKTSTWTRHWDENSASAYIRNGEKVIVYDNPRSIAVKVKTAIDYGLGGLMVWSIDTDDFRGACEAEPDTYLDFMERYNKLVDDPVLQEALKNLNLPDANRIENLSRRTAYAVSNNKLHLRLAEPEFSNYPLMRTINEATTLALEEKRILDEMAAVVKQNEIGDKPDDKGSAQIVAVNFCLLLCAVLTFKLF